MNEMNLAPLKDWPDPDFIPLETGQIALYRFGDKPQAPAKFVFLHANGFNALTYASLLRAASEALPVLAFDLRGHGATSLEADPQNLTDWRAYRDDIIEALKQMNEPGPFIFAGHSMGATVSLLIAARWPEAAASVVAFEPVLIASCAAKVLHWARRIAPAFDFSLARGAERRRRRFAGRDEMFVNYKGRGAFKNWPDDMLWDYIRTGTKEIENGAVELSCAPEWEAANFRRAGFAITKTFASIKCPVEIIYATVGSSAPHWIVSGLTRKFPNVTADWREGFSHFLPMEDRAAAARALTAAAGRLSTGRKAGRSQRELRPTVSAGND